VIVIGAGLAGLTAANRLARCGRSVLLLEQHYNYGGMATWFRRKGGHIFDISLHGFPIGMIKSCRKYWTQEIADHIDQLKGIRFDNPQFSIETTFDRQDFTRLMIEHFGIPAETVEDFFNTVRKMDFYDDNSETTRELFERFFPGRRDVWRLLMEPIAYANGSTLDDPAITYGIVFSNFMSRGVYIFRGGTDKLIFMMRKELEANSVDLRKQVLVEQILIEGGRACGVVADGRRIGASSVLSNANLKTTVEKMIDPRHLSDAYLKASRAVRLNNSSCQVFMGIRKGETLPYIGDLLFTSVKEEFDSVALCAKEITSRTFSMYYPDIRPGSDRYAVVSSTNANWDDWARLDEEAYRRAKHELEQTTIDALEKYIPGVRGRIDHAADARCHLRHQVRGAAGEHGSAETGRGHVPRRQRGDHHVGVAGGD
jgi:phytoene dehydrogenase-like protein